MYNLEVTINGVDISTYGGLGRNNSLPKPKFHSWLLVDVAADWADAPRCIVSGSHICTPTPDCAGLHTAGDLQTISIITYVRPPRGILESWLSGFSSAVLG